MGILDGIAHKLCHQQQIYEHFRFQYIMEDNHIYDDALVTMGFLFLCVPFSCVFAMHFCEKDVKCFRIMSVHSADNTKELQFTLAKGVHKSSS
jgi:hypothetical protein